MKESRLFPVFAFILCDDEELYGDEESQVENAEESENRRESETAHFA